MTASPRDLSVAVADTVAGFSAGLISTLLVHPLDLIKTRLQVDRHSPSKLGNSVRVLRQIARESRSTKSFWIQGYYRGLTPNLVGNTASWSLYFLWYGQIKQLIGKTREGGQLTSTDYLLSSAAAGVATSALTNPIWVVKTRMMSSDSGVRGAYRSLMDGLIQIVTKEGTRGLYRGFLPSLFGVSQAAVQFMSYEELKRWRLGQRQQQQQKLQRTSPQHFETSTKELGPHAGAEGSSTATGPFLPNQTDASSHPRASLSSTRGVDRQAPIYEAQIDLKQQNVGAAQSPVSESNVVGRIRLSTPDSVVEAAMWTPPTLSNLDFIYLSALSKVISGALTYPYQVVRARLQTYDAETLYTSARNVMMQTYKSQGIAGFYKGLAPNLIRVLPSTCITFLVYENTRSYLQAQPQPQSNASSAS